MATILTAAAVLVVPMALGAGAGVLMRRGLGRRIAGVFGAIACVLSPAALFTAATVYFPIVGLWDGVTVGVLCGAGMLFAAHQAFADVRNVWLTCGAVVAGFAVLEVAARLFLGVPPAFPVGDGPHLLLKHALRTTPPDAQAFRTEGVPYALARDALRGDLAVPGEALEPADRPPSVMVTREIVCSIVYGPAYKGLIDVRREPSVVFPERFTPRAGTAPRVLHIGDSLVFGANVAREDTFVAGLRRLEPEIEHINGGISGMAPDDYLAVLRSWVARHRIDLAVIYLFAGNDLAGLDAPHPCSNWQSLLVYDDGQARLRFPAGPRSEPGIGLRWLAINSPLPYLGRVSIAAHSSAAAFLGSALASLAERGVHRDPPEVQFQHIEHILRSARDELARRGVGLVVVALPHAGSLRGAEPWFEREVMAIARRLGLPVRDATEPIRAALDRGENPVQSDGSHLNETGHRLMAQWLHDRHVARPSAGGR